jgi:hypothetical protein
MTGTGTQEETAAAAGTSAAAAAAAAAAAGAERGAGKKKNKAAAAAAAAAEPAMGEAAGCLADENLQGREAADVALDAVRQQLAALQAGRQQQQGSAMMSLADVARLEQDLHRCGAAGFMCA